MTSICPTCYGSGKGKGGGGGGTKEEGVATTIALAMGGLVIYCTWGATLWYYSLLAGGIVAVVVERLLMGPLLFLNRILGYALTLFMVIVAFYYLHKIFG